MTSQERKRYRIACILYESMHSKSSAMVCDKYNISLDKLMRYVESHLEKYKLIVDTRREKRNYIEVELLPILQKFNSNIIATSYKIYYHEEFLDIRYTDKSVRLYITATNLEGIKKLVHKELKISMEHFRG